MSDNESHIETPLPTIPTNFTAAKLSGSKIGASRLVICDQKLLSLLDDEGLTLGEVIDILIDVMAQIKLSESSGSVHSKAANAKKKGQNSDKQLTSAIVTLMSTLATTIRGQVDIQIQEARKSLSEEFTAKVLGQNQLLLTLLALYLADFETGASSIASVLKNETLNESKSRLHHFRLSDVALLIKRELQQPDAAIKTEGTGDVIAKFLTKLSEASPSGEAYLIMGDTTTPEKIQAHNNAGRDVQPAEDSYFPQNSSGRPRAASGNWPRGQWKGPNGGKGSGPPKKRPNSGNNW